MDHGEKTTGGPNGARDLNTGDPDRSAPDTSPPDTSDASTGELTECVMRVAHLIRRSAMANLAPLDLTPAQSRALRTISKSEQPIRMGELATHLGVVPRSATGLVDVLEQSGLVERSVDPANRRSVLVTLTEPGRERQRAMARARADAGDGLFGELTPAERRTLADLLDKVQSAPRGGH